MYKILTNIFNPLNIKYNIDYAADQSKYPNNLVLLASGGAPPGPNGAPAPDPDRMYFSYRRDIKDKKGGKTIGTASYLIHVYKVEINDNKKSGSMYSSYTSHHEFKKDGKEYDIMYQGNLNFILGLRRGSTQTEINSATPYLYVTGNKFDNASAIAIFMNGKKINHGNNVVTLKPNGDYQVKETYGF